MTAQTLSPNGAADLAREWLEADGIGGFAMGTAGLARTRRYHALLLSATTPPTGRMALVNGLEVWIDTQDKSYALSSQAYAPDVVWPDGASHLREFRDDPWPTWTFEFPNGALVTQEILVAKEGPETIVRWSVVSDTLNLNLRVRPLISGRDYHSLHHENAVFNFEARVEAQTIVFEPYPGVPAIRADTNGGFKSAPLWFRNFFYAVEAERGLDCVEDLASPGEFIFALSHANPAVMRLRASMDSNTGDLPDINSAIGRERLRRSAFSGRLARSADAYRVRRGAGSTVVAGYPWFTDWGRDTFISMRGVLLAYDHDAAACEILMTWAPFVSEGMIPNLFPDRGAPEYNSVDASLWYVVAAHDLLNRAGAATFPPKATDTIIDACNAIIEGYSKGARYGIGLDRDGLLRAGEIGYALTWMDARVNGAAVTPRIGKPVEIQALWFNALRASARWTDSWRRAADRTLQAFLEKFPDPAGGLYDVVDVDHQEGRIDNSVRPNQIFAAGGLPFVLVDGTLARHLVDRVESTLLTPNGLRTLAPDNTAYVGHYCGGPAQRDSSYHQGSVWPWLSAAFVDAWLRTRGDAPAALEEARNRFLSPMLRHLDEGGLGHISELADGDAPHAPRGCPFQAWSLAELIRIAARLGAPDVINQMETKA